MNGINKLTLIGTAGKDPEVNHTAGGKAIAQISIATNESWIDKNTGQKVEETEWTDCVFFGKLAEIVGQYVSKGSLLYIEGKKKTDSWDDKTTGEKKYKVKCYAHTMQMLGGKSKDDNGTKPQAAPQASSSAGLSDQDGFDDIPFSPVHYRTV